MKLEISPTIVNLIDQLTRAQDEVCTQHPKCHECPFGEKGWSCLLDAATIKLNELGGYRSQYKQTWEIEAHKRIDKVQERDTQTLVEYIEDSIVKTRIDWRRCESGNIDCYLTPTSGDFKYLLRVFTNRNNSGWNIRLDEEPNEIVPIEMREELRDFYWEDVHFDEDES